MGKPQNALRGIRKVEYAPTGAAPPPPSLSDLVNNAILQGARNVSEAEARRRKDKGFNPFG